MRKRVVVTGIGILCSLGKSYPEVIDAVQKGTYGGGTITGFSTEGYKMSKACVVNELPQEIKNCTEIEDANKYALYCAERSIRDSGISLCEYAPERIGVCLASSNAGEISRELYRHTETSDGQNGVIVETPATLTGLIASEIHAEGPRISVSTACAAGGNSIGYAFDLIRNDKCDVVLSGGIDPMSKLSYSGFLILNTISSEPVRPFDATRKGIDLGEAGVVFVMESLDSALKRGAHIYCEILGYGISNDAYHTSAPDPEGQGAKAAMEQCLAVARLRAEDVDYINAHGTGTRYNDEMELKAVSSVFGEHAKKIPISSSKSMHGHALSAAGSLELAVTIGAIERNFVPITITTENVMDEYRDYSIVTEKNKGKYKNYVIDVALSNSFGFAGNNTCLAVGRYQ
mgnify:CR=1 FL=1